MQNSSRTMDFVKGIRLLWNRVEMTKMGNRNFRVDFVYMDKQFG